MKIALSIMISILSTYTIVDAKASSVEVWGCRERSFFDSKPIASKDYATGKMAYEKTGMIIQDNGNTFDLITFGKSSSARVPSPQLHVQDEDWMIGDDGRFGVYYKGINANAGNYVITMGKRNLIIYTCVKGAK